MKYLRQWIVQKLRYFLIKGGSMIRLTFIATAILMFSGCGTALTVHQEVTCANGKCGIPVTQKIDGIPFYSKVMQYKQETVYKTDLVQVTVTAKFPAVPPDIKEEVWNWSAEMSPREARTLKVSVESSKDIKKTLADWDAKPQTQLTQRLISNKIISQSVVDNSKTYFINSNVPLVGSSTLTAKLASDQTLTEATGTVQDNTLPAIEKAVTDVMTSLPKGLGGTPAPTIQFTQVDISKTVVYRRIVPNDRVVPKALTALDAQTENANIEIDEKTAAPSSTTKNEKGWSITGTAIPPASSTPVAK
jgi:hypothetical protein